MKKRVWLFCIFISGLVCTSCALAQEEANPVSKVLLEQDTLEMEPDFSYVVPLQQPHIIVDQNGYQSADKKIAFFYGNNLEETFEIRDEKTDEVVYSGTLRQVKEADGKMIYTGAFTDFAGAGKYYIHQKQVGDSHTFTTGASIYNRKYKEMENLLLKEKPETVSEQAYLLANYMFIDEMFADTWTNMSYIRAKLELLLQSQDVATGAFYSEIADTMVEGGTYEGTISLSTTAQMSGILAEYAYLYRNIEDPVFVNQCYQASLRAYAYMERYRDNTDTDAWYYAATQLYRLTRQYKYRNAIIEYDTLAVESRSSTPNGYTMLADFTYLSTPYGTDYNRCELLLAQYLDRAQYIATEASREHYFVLPELNTMSEKDILDDMVMLGIVNRILSGQEYAAVQKNYIHYLSGVNPERQDYWNKEMRMQEEAETINIGNATKMLVVYANLYQKVE